MTSTSQIASQLKEIHETRNATMSQYLDWQDVFNSGMAVAVLLQKRAPRYLLTTPVQTALWEVSTKLSSEMSHQPIDYCATRILLSMRKALTNVEVCA